MEPGGLRAACILGGGCEASANRMLRLMEWVRSESLGLVRRGCVQTRVNRHIQEYARLQQRGL